MPNIGQGDVGQGDWGQGASGGGTPVNIVATGGTPQSTLVNTAFGFLLEVTITDGSGNPVSGIPVKFTAPSAGPSAIFQGGSNIGFGGTGGDGRAQSPPLTANGQSGGYTVIASVEGFGPTASFSLTNTTGAPANITATAGTPQNASISLPFAVNLQVTVTDAGFNGVSGVTVTFTAPGAGASGTFAGGINTAVTDGFGVATSAVFTANGTTGAYSVTASVAGLVPTATFSLTNLVVVSGTGAFAVSIALLGSGLVSSSAPITGTGSFTVALKLSGSGVVGAGLTPITGTASFAIAHKLSGTAVLLVLPPPPSNSGFRVKAGSRRA